MWQAVFCGTIQALELAFITCFQQAYLGPTEPAVMWRNIDELRNLWQISNCNTILLKSVSFALCIYINIFN